MNRMNTQQRLDCLLKQIDRLAERQGAGVTFNQHDLESIINQCGFKDLHEVGFYLRSLGDEGLLKPDCAADNSRLGGTITIQGYRHLDTLIADNGLASGARS